MSDWKTASEMAREEGVTPQCIYQWWRDGKLERAKVAGRGYHYRKKCLVNLSYWQICARVAIDRITGRDHSDLDPPGPYALASISKVAERHREAWEKLQQMGGRVNKGVHLWIAEAHPSYGQVEGYGRTPQDAVERCWMKWKKAKSNDDV